MATSGIACLGQVGRVRSRSASDAPRSGAKLSEGPGWTSPVVTAYRCLRSTRSRRPGRQFVTNGTQPHRLMFDRECIASVLLPRRPCCGARVALPFGSGRPSLLVLEQQQLAAGDRPKQTGMGIDLDVSRDDHLLLLARLAPYSIHSEAWAGSTSIYSSCDSGDHTRFSLTPDQVAASAERLARAGYAVPDVLVRRVHPRRRRNCLVAQHVCCHGRPARWICRRPGRGSDLTAGNRRPGLHRGSPRPTWSSARGRARPRTRISPLR